MTENIWIFGDSYSDKEYTYDTSFESWPYSIEKTYNVKNFSKIGSSPDYSLYKLFTEIESVPDDELKNVTLIFFISGIHRFNFKFFDLKDHAITTKFLDTNDESVMKDYKKYSQFIKNFFNHYIFHSSYDKSELIKIIGCLSLLSNKFKKVLVWPIFDRITIDITNTNNFYFVKHPLHKIEPWPQGVVNDVRNNHMSKHNHATMLSQLTNWIDNNMEIDINNFNKIH